MFRIQVNTESAPFSVKRREDVSLFLSLYDKFKRWGIYSRPYLVPPRGLSVEGTGYIACNYVSPQESDKDLFLDCMTLALLALRDRENGLYNSVYETQGGQFSSFSGGDYSKMRLEALNILSRVQEWRVMN